MNTVSEKDFVESMNMLLGGKKNKELREIVKNIFRRGNKCQSKK